MVNFRHGHAHNGRESPTYRSWANMIQRCLNKNNDAYENYGGRGISVCDWWVLRFENFLTDMGERPAGKTLDRIDNDGDYEATNCRWATNTEQCHNMRKNIRVVYAGYSRSLKEWSIVTGIKEQTLYSRITKLGWSVERTLTAPAGRYVRKEAVL